MVPVAVILVSMIAAQDVDPLAETGVRLECGINCLYLLLNSTGNPVDFGSLRRSFPAPAEAPRGNSLAQLRDVAERFGLPLEGIRLSRRDFPLEAPVIA